VVARTLQIMEEANVINCKDEDTWGEVILDNSPFAEYLKSISNIDGVEITPISFEPEIKNDANNPSIQQEIQTKKDNVVIEDLHLTDMYRTLYSMIVGSDLLHPSESIFLCDDVEDLALAPTLGMSLNTFFL
jgi:hypothetical protein